MNVVFEKVVLDNFLSFEHAEIDLRNYGLTFVSGVNKNPSDNAKSNGSGKSALWDSISWALTGTTIRGVSKEVANIHTSGGCCVELYFSVDSTNYAIKRYKDHTKFGNNLKLYKNDTDISGKGIRDTEKILESILPELNDSLIGSVIILGQGLPQRFSNNTPSGRKEVLETLSKSDFMIDYIKARIGDRKSDLSIELENTQDKLIDLRARKELLERQQSTINDKLSKLTTPNLSELEEVRKKHESVIKDQQEVNSVIVSLQENLSTLMDELSKLQRELSDENKKVSSEYDEKLSSMSSVITSLQVEHAMLKKDLQEASSITDICPTCGQKIPDVHRPNLQPLQEALQSKLNELNSRTSEYNLYKQDKSNAILQLEKQYSDMISLKRQEITTIQSDIKNKSEHSKTLDSELRVTEKRLTEIETLLSTYTTQKCALEKELENTNNDINNLSKDILYYIEKESSLKLHIEVVNKMSTIASREFRGHLLKNVIDFISLKAKEYCKDIFNTDLIEFTLDGNNINISYDNKLYENLSSGERVKCDIIVQLSLRSMLCSFNNFSCNIIVLDEIFDGLDATGCDQVLNLVSKKLTDIDSIFIVSHRNDLPISYDRSIIIEKDARGISRICKV